MSMTDERILNIDRTLVRIETILEQLIEDFAEVHAPNKVGGTDEPSEGQALGSKRAEEGES